MKASKVLKKYAADERNFQRVNMRSQSFKGKDLSGVDFSETDIRSANFTGATLRGANFSGAKCGLQKRWVIFLMLISWLLTLILGLGALLVTNLYAQIFNYSKYRTFGWVSLIVSILFWVFIIRRGLKAETVAVMIGVGIVAGLFIGLVVGAAVGVEGAGTATAIGALVGAAGIGLAVGAAVVAAAVAVAGVGAAIVIVAVIVIGAATAGVAGVVLAEVAVGAATAGVAVAVAGGLVEVYIGLRAMKGDERDTWLRSFAIAFAATGGTSFHGADLTEANFAGAKLKSTDFREAILTRVRWYEAKMLNRVRPGESYLKNELLRQLLITGKGQNQNFDRLDLRGINLQDANLQDASFIGTDLNRANLQNANLSRAKLVQTLLEGTDLTRATLTGAYIEDWGISNTTKLIQIDCDYIFLKLPTKEAPDPQRRPADQERNFEPNEFAKLAQKIPNTVDLVFKDGIDWQTFLQTFQELRVESDTGELPVIQTIENKGDGAFVIRVKVPEEIDEAEYERKFWLKYQPMLEAKDEQIAFYRKEIEEIRKGNTKLIGVVETMAEKETTKYDLRGAKFGGGFGGEKQEGGTFYDYSSNPSNTNLAEAAAEIQQLLEQLSQTNPTSTDREKMTVVAEAVDQIENNPTLKAKVINALKAGGTEAFKEAIDHPLVNILVATIEGWQDAE